MDKMLIAKLNSPSEFTLDLSEFNVNVMTGNNGAHQRSPYDPELLDYPNVTGFKCSNQLRL